MARFDFGAGVADFVVQPSDGMWTVAAGAVVTFWDAAADGVQYTDLLDGAGSPITQVTATAYGALPRFRGPDGVTGMWADAGGPTRAWMDAHSITTGGTAGGSVQDWLNVRAFGAAGDNVSDDTAAIQAALTACPMGGIVYLPAGAYRTSAPLTIPPAVTLMGTHTNLMTVVGLVDPPCYIRPLAGFAGAAVIQLLDQIDGGYTTISAEHRILNVMIDGTDLEAPGIDGIQARGNIQNVGLRDLTIRHVTGAGINTQANGGFFPYSWRCHRVMIDNVGWHGFAVQVMTDITMVDCQAIGCGANGFEINNAANSQMIGCRAEWNRGEGIHITGDWATGAGSGGILIGDCSTDRNDHNGVLVDATGSPPIQIDNLLTRRDGRNDGAGGGGYAGLAVDGATIPVIVGLVTCYPGVDDNGTQVNSPQFGARFTDSAYVSVAAGFLHAAAAGWSDGGGNTVLRRGLNIAERTGTTAAPVDAFAPPTDVAGNLDVGGYLAASSGQSAGQWNIWAGQAKALNLGAAGGGIAIAEGANARMNVATLVAGAVTVANTSVTANTRALVSRQAGGGTLGHLTVTKTPGVGFTITSSSNTDTSTVAWVLVEPA
ncbi:right-handed parallel beta-helix repeat-containing protein [Streptomyces anulatus]|uniref:Right-handed parallel beta-helix repeat-containing protein n=1 Tax=Streptomyces anulatus TaxID=1892 RepID=A0ABZ1ZIG2_STRAQ|nr:glycosyl hydrolase family 28-related protein [Streptomyces anulatus]